MNQKQFQQFSKLGQQIDYKSFGNQTYTDSPSQGNNKFSNQQDQSLVNDVKIQNQNDKQNKVEQNSFTFNNQTSQRESQSTQAFNLNQYTNSNKPRRKAQFNLPIQNYSDESQQQNTKICCSPLSIFKNQDKATVKSCPQIQNSKFHLVSNELASNLAPEYYENLAYLENRKSKSFQDQQFIFGHLHKSFDQSMQNTDHAEGYLQDNKQNVIFYDQIRKHRSHLDLTAIMSPRTPQQLWTNDSTYDLQQSPNLLGCPSILQHITSTNTRTPLSQARKTSPQQNHRSQTPLKYNVANRTPNKVQQMFQVNQNENCLDISQRIGHKIKYSKLRNRFKKLICAQSNVQQQKLSPIQKEQLNCSSPYSFRPSPFKHNTSYTALDHKYHQSSKSQLSTNISGHSYQQSSRKQPQSSKSSFRSSNKSPQTGPAHKKLKQSFVASNSDRNTSSKKSSQRERIRYVSPSRIPKNYSEKDKKQLVKQIYKFHDKFDKARNNRTANSSSQSGNQDCIYIQTLSDSDRIGQDKNIIELQSSSSGVNNFWEGQTYSKYLSSNTGARVKLNNSNQMNSNQSEDTQPNSSLIFSYTNTNASINPPTQAQMDMEELGVLSSIFNQAFSNQSIQDSIEQLRQSFAFQRIQSHSGILKEEIVLRQMLKNIERQRFKSRNQGQQFSANYSGSFASSQKLTSQDTTQRYNSQINSQIFNSSSSAKVIPLPDIQQYVSNIMSETTSQASHSQNISQIQNHSSNFPKRKHSKKQSRVSLSNQPIPEENNVDVDCNLSLETLKNIQKGVQLEKNQVADSSIQISMDKADISESNFYRQSYLKSLSTKDEKSQQKSQQKYISNQAKPHQCTKVQLDIKKGEQNLEVQQANCDLSKITNRSASGEEYKSEASDLFRSKMDSFLVPCTHINSLISHSISQGFNKSARQSEVSKWEIPIQTSQIFTKTEPDQRNFRHSDPGLSINGERQPLKDIGNRSSFNSIPRITTLKLNNSIKDSQNYNSNTDQSNQSDQSGYMIPTVNNVKQIEKQYLNQCSITNQARYDKDDVISDNQSSVKESDQDVILQQCDLLQTDLNHENTDQIIDAFLQRQRTPKSSSELDNGGLADPNSEIDNMKIKKKQSKNPYLTSTQNDIIQQISEKFECQNSMRLFRTKSSFQVCKLLGDVNDIESFSSELSQSCMSGDDIKYLSNALYSA